MLFPHLCVYQAQLARLESLITWSTPATGDNVDSSNVAIGADQVADAEERDADNTGDLRGTSAAHVGEKRKR